jgi:RNA:NAD 2'-phosphotransferase (TPT1/KptA family)
MGHVLKANQVRLDEPVRLTIDAAAAPDQGVSRQCRGQPRVRIVETNPDSAVIEVTCSCGKVAHVRCDYAASTATEPARS